MLHALALLLVAVPSADAAACPQGDAPRGSIASLDAGEGSVSLVVDDEGIGHLRYRLPWANQADRAAKGTLSLAAVEHQPIIVTHARIVGGGVAKLDEASEAAAAFDEFNEAMAMGVEPADAKPGRARTALLVSGDGARIDVAVSAACSVRSLVIELDALVEPVPSAGGFSFSVPVPDGEGAFALAVSAVGRQVFIDGQRRSKSERADGTLDGAATGYDVELTSTLATVTARGGVFNLLSRAAPAAPPEVDAADAAEAAAVDASSDVTPAPFALVHAAVDLPRQLSHAPAELRVVFVVDASVSAGDEGVVLAEAIVNAWLDAAPDDVGWALVTAARKPNLLVPPWRTKSERALPRIEVQNGSDIAAALALAQRIAGDATAGSGRIVVLSDLQLSHKHQPRLPVALGTGNRATLTHLVELPDDVGGSSVSFDRVFAEDDVSAFAVERTGGVYLTVYEGEQQLAALGRHLVRPTHIDQPVILVDGDVVDDGAEGSEVTVRVFGNDIATSLPEVLHEGEGVRVSHRVAKARHASFTGWLWAERVDVPVTTSPTEKTLALGVMVNGPLGSDLGDDEVRAAAFSAGVVSRVTSLVEVPQWRPATTALYGAGGFGCSCGGCSSCSRCGTGCGLRVGEPRVSRTQEILNELAAAAGAACGKDAVEVGVEFGDGEILGVNVVNGGVCVGEFFWRQRLDELSAADFESHAERTALWPTP